jgi:ABC-2 type transport system permease protein
MTRTLVVKLLRDARWALLVVWLILFVFSLMWVKVAQRVTTEIAPFFNAIGLAAQLPDVKAAIDEVVFRGPGKVSQAVLGGADIRFENPNDFLAVELLHPVVMIIAGLWAVGRAAGAVSGEIDRGTMELLMSQPVPRNRLILAHLIVDVIVIPIICSAVFLGTRAGLELAGPFKIDYSVLEKLPKVPALMQQPRPEFLDVDVSRQKHALLNLAGLIFALSGLTMAVSSAGRNRWRAIAWSVLIVLGMFIANVLGQLWDSAAYARPLTVFFYYQPQKIWLKENWLAELGEVWNGGQELLTVPMVPVLFTVGALGYLFAWRTFVRRDLPAPL